MTKYTLLPSGLTDIPLGLAPIIIVAETVSVTYILLLSGLKDIHLGSKL